MPTVNIKAHRPTLVQSGLRCHYDEQLNPAGVNADTTGEEVHGKDSLLFFPKKEKKTQKKKREKHTVSSSSSSSPAPNGMEGLPTWASRQAGRWTGTAHRLRIPPSVQEHLTCQLHERAPRSGVASLAHGLPSESGPLSVAFLDGGEEERERRRSGSPSVAEPGASPEQQQHGQAARRVSSSGGGGRVVPSPLSRRPRGLLPSRGQHDGSASTQNKHTHACTPVSVFAFGGGLSSSSPSGGKKERGKEGGSRVTCPSLCLYK